MVILLGVCGLDVGEAVDRVRVARSGIEAGCGGEDGCGFWS